jgi:hypothetical protein
MYMETYKNKKATFGYNSNQILAGPHNNCYFENTKHKKHQTVGTANKISKKWLKENLLARFGETLVNRSIIQ